VNPIILRRRPELAQETVRALNRLGRKVGRPEKAFVIESSRVKSRTQFEIHYPGIERGEVLAILRLLLMGWRTETITPIMVAQERTRPSLGARPK
jgi:hypothetical protein